MHYPIHEKKSWSGTIGSSILSSMESFLKYLVIAENAIVDEASNKLTAVNIFGDVRVASDAPIRLNFVIAGELYAPEAKTTDTGKLVVRLISPSGVEHAVVELNGGFDKGGRVVFTAFFSLVEFSESGQYVVDLTLNGVTPTKEEKLCYFNVHHNYGEVQ
jgi:hypothetical protein